MSETRRRVDHIQADIVLSLNQLVIGRVDHIQADIVLSLNQLIISKVTDQFNSLIISSMWNK